VLDSADRRTTGQLELRGNRISIRVAGEWLAQATYPVTVDPLLENELIFADGFESGDFSAWTSVYTDSGDLSVSTAAALVGAYGMQALIDDTATMSVRDYTPAGEPRYRARFYFDPNALSMAEGDAHLVLAGKDDVGTDMFRVWLRRSGGVYQVRANLADDGTGYPSTGNYTISDEPHFIEIDWVAASAPGANDGTITLWIDGVQQGSVSGVDNDTRRVEKVYLGPSSGLDAGTAGTQYFDAFESRRSTTIGSGVMANFSADPVQGAAPLTVTFTNTTQLTSALTSYLWNFGDGYTSTLTQPVHSYTAAGSFTVTLTALTGAEQATVTQTNFITVTGNAVTPVADFSASPVSGVAPLTVTFTNQSTPTETITSYLWNFGDGVTSTITNPVHAYTSTGYFTVALTAFAGTAQDTLTRTNLIRVTTGDVVTSVVTINYAYDPLYRLTNADYTGAYTHSIDYSYDAAGNRLTQTVNGSLVTYTYDAADRLTSVNGVAYTYDANGNQLSDGMRTFTYDAANRLTRVVSDTLTTEYTYLGDGTRLAQTVNGVQTRYTVDVSGPLPHVLEEWRGASVTRYLYAVGMIASEQDGVWQYQHGDARGSVRQTTDATGLVKSATDYDPFGVVIRSAGEASGSFGYAHEQQDAASGLTFLRARYYDPTTGRFLTRDTYPAYAPVPQTLHRYVYVKNDPVNHIDPAGLCWLFDSSCTFDRWLKDTRDDADRKFGVWRRDLESRLHDLRRDPVGSQIRGIRGSVSSAIDYSTRKGAELVSTVREVGKAVERGDWDGAFARTAVGALRVSGVTDLAPTRHLVLGVLSEANQNLAWMEHSKAVWSDPRASLEAKVQAGGEMFYTAFNVMSFGGLEQTRQGLMQGDLLLAASGALQMVPGLGTAANLADAVLASREVVGGLTDNDGERAGMGLFVLGLNAIQLRGGSHTPLDCQCRWYKGSFGILVKAPSTILSP
jgi:RHS repeat-associated protein